MKLLIVEDEYYTRKGVIEEIDFAGVGIDEIEEADDGVNALELARSFRPDIVLADVRMPRMDGVAMSFELRKLIPDCQIIFMSGYADKEYLKAAIELKAMRYIEKPFRSSELREVLKAAVAACRAAADTARRETELHALSQTGIPLLRAEIALALTDPDPDFNRINSMIEASGLAIGADTQLVVVLVRPAAGAFPADSAFRDRFQGAVERTADASSIRFLAAFKGDSLAVVILLPGPDRRRLPAEREIEGSLTRLFRSLPEIELLAGVGGAVSGAQNALASHEGASSALDAAFFIGAGSIVFHASAGAADLPLDERSLDAFQASLDREDAGTAASILESLAAGMRQSGSRQAGRARDFLAGFMLRLISYAERRGIDPFERGESARALSEAIERRGTLAEVVSLLEARLKLVFARLLERRDEGRVVVEVKHFIHRNYQSPGLSIQRIAAEVKLSTAYVCRLFREATGQTIHRHMIEYRLERAKELLADKNLPKMSEVAARSGFADANYFARAFRKLVGASPSEFRERILS